MTYMEFISQFEVIENPPIKKGFHRHHIVPRCVQRKQFGKVVDKRQIYVTPAQHLWLHILYDQENGTKTANKLITDSHIKKDNIHCYEDCLPYNDIKHIVTTETREKISKNNPRYWKDKHLPQETRQKLSDSHKGQESWHKGKTGVYSQESLERMSTSHKGQPSGMKNKKHRPESLEKISKSSKGRMIGVYWWNDGEKCKRSKTQPGPDWERGRLSRRKSA